MDPISVTSSTISVLVAGLQILRISRSAARYLKQTDRYLDPEPESATEAHIRAKHGALTLAALRFLMPGVSAQLRHIDQYVLHGADEVLLEFRRSYINDCNLTSVAGAIITQVAITALSLPSLSQSHWVARACFVISLISGALSVYFAVLLQRIVGGLYEARTLRAWLSSLDTYPDMKDLRALKRFLQQSSTANAVANAAGDPTNHQIDVEAARTLQDHFARFDLQQRRSGVVSLFSALILETPGTMMNISLGSFLAGLAVYFGFLWTRGLDADAGRGDSRNIFIVFVLTVVCCIGMYSVPRGIKSNDEYAASVYSRIRSTLDSMIVENFQDRAAREKGDGDNADELPLEKEEARASGELPPPPPLPPRDGGGGDVEVEIEVDSVHDLSIKKVPTPHHAHAHAHAHARVRAGGSPPPPAAPSTSPRNQNTLLTAALRRAMQAHQELSAAELALSKEYANILASTRTETEEERLMNTTKCEVVDEDGDIYD